MCLLFLSRFSLKNTSVQQKVMAALAITPLGVLAGPSLPLYIYLLCVCVLCVFAYGHMCHGAHVEIRTTCGSSFSPEIIWGTGDQTDVFRLGSKPVTS